MTRKAWIAVGGSLALVVVLAIVLIAVIAVDGDDDSAPGEPVFQGNGPAELGGMAGPPAEVQECLSEKGLELPTPGENPDGDFDPQEMQDALSECGLDGPTGVPFGGGAPPG